MRSGYEASGVVLAVGDGAEGPGGPLHPATQVIAYPVPGAYADRAGGAGVQRAG